MIDSEVGSTVFIHGESWCNSSHVSRKSSNVTYPFTAPSHKRAAVLTLFVKLGEMFWTKPLQGRDIGWTSSKWACRKPLSHGLRLQLTAEGVKRAACSVVDADQRSWPIYGRQIGVKSTMCRNMGWAMVVLPRQISLECRAEDMAKQ